MKYCDGAAGRYPCPHPDDCTISCGFNDATATRRIKPYPHVPPAFDEPETEWREISGLFIWFIRLVVFVWLGLMAVALASIVVQLI